jgi:hypothetical protein
MELLQTIQYRLLNQPRYRPRLGAFAGTLEMMARRLNEQILAIEAKERELLRRVELITGLNTGWSKPSWFGGGFFTPVSRLVASISIVGLYRSPLVLTGIGRRIYGGYDGTPDIRVRRAIPDRFRGGRDYDRLDRDDINRLARQGTFVNEGPTPEEMERAQRMYGENPGGPGYRGSPGFGRNRA